MKPLIGITAEINPATNLCEVNHEYALAVAAAGGTPVMLAPLSDSPSYIEDVLASLDGVLLSGGGDISPRAYGETLRHPSILSVNERHTPKGGCRAIGAAASKVELKGHKAEGELHGKGPNHGADANEQEDDRHCGGRRMPRLGGGIGNLRLVDEPELIDQYVYGWKH